MAGPDDEPAPDDEGAATSAAEPGAEPGARPANQAAVYRARYAAALAGLGVDERIFIAHSADAADAHALAFDPDPRVIAALLDNPAAGLEVARLAARHHRNSVGIEIIARRGEWLRDAQLVRNLLTNPQCGEVVLARLVAPRPLLWAWRLCTDRDLPELTRTRARTHLRRKYIAAPSEERAELVLRSEGRCLPLLVGCTFDARMTALLCARPVASVMLVQSLARFSATPPQLLAHLLRQPMVRTNAALKRLVLQHPNVPADARG